MRLGGWSRLYLLVIVLWGIALFVAGLLDWWKRPDADLINISIGYGVIWTATSLAGILFVYAIRWVSRGFDHP